MVDDIAATRRLRIIVVDDDALIVMTMSDLLDDLGHEVVEAGSGAEALDILARDTAIDLLITDQSMPRMTGLELIAHARAIRPDLPAVIASGYGDVLQDTLPGVVKLNKPFAQAALSHAVHAALAERAR